MKVLSNEYTSSISWLPDAEHQIAMVKYTGEFPGHMAHKQNKNKNSNYIRAPLTTLKK